MLDARSRRAVLLLTLALLAFGLLLAAFAPRARLQRLGPLVAANAYDFNDFYCAGRVAGHGDPYAIAPLAACEGQAPDGVGKNVVVMPAPVPPFALPIYTPFGDAPRFRAEYAWLVILVAATLCAAILFEPLLDVPALVLFGIFVVGTGHTALQLGQPPPIGLALSALAATLLVRRRYAGAAIATTAGLLEPHLGLPACIALFAFVPRARLPLVGCLLVETAIALVEVGPATCLTYLTHVLPAHALAEAPNAYQYSTTLALVVAGLPETLATKLGSLWYAIMTAAGIVLAGKLRQRFNDDAFIVLFPVLPALFGGSFVHEQQLVALVPAAFLLIKHLRGNTFLIGLVATLTSALAWEPAPTGFKETLAVVACCVAAALLAARPSSSRRWWNDWTSRQRARLAVGLCIGCAYIAITVIDHRLERRVIFVSTSPAAYAIVAANDRDLPEFNWGRTIRSDPSYGTLTLGHGLSKLPTWLGIGTMCVIAWQSVRSRQRLRATALR